MSGIKINPIVIAITFFLIPALWVTAQTENNSKAYNMGSLSSLWRKTLFTLI